MPLQSLMRGYLLRMRNAEKLLDSLEANTEPLEEVQDEDAEQYEDAQEDFNPEVDGNDPSSRDQFYEDLQDYLDVSGAEIERHPVIDGREVELWDLFSVATQQDCAVEDRDWDKVAQRLGFDWTSSSACAKDLKECYDRNLADFEEAIGSYDDQDDITRAEDERVSLDDEEQGLPQTSDAVTAPKKPSPAPLSPVYRSPSPVAGVKRSFQQSNDPRSELSYPSDGSSKRRRRDKRKAIPQTPEHELGLAGGSSSRAALQDFSSPLRSRGVGARPDGVYSVDDADDFLNNGLQDNIQEIDDLPDLAPPRKKRFLEPETQDFGDAMGHDDDVRPSIENDTGYITDDDDISPSQQLLSELDAVSSPARPVAVRSHGAVSANRPPFANPRPRLLGGPPKTHTSASGIAAINGSTKGAAYNDTSRLKATKRSLPQQYQMQSAAPAAARPSTSAPNQNGIVARPTVAAPAPTPGPVTQRSKQTVSVTPTRAVQLSAQLRNPSMGAATTSAEAADPAHSRYKAHAPDFGAEYVEAQFEHFMALGYDNARIARAMEATSVQRGPLTVALESLHSGNGLPQDAEGVWTDEDDRKLRKIIDYARRQEAGVPSSGAGENTRERTQVARYRSSLLAKHRSFYAVRMAFMVMMDKGPTA